MNYYETLGLPRAATQAEIEAAFDEWKRTEYSRLMQSDQVRATTSAQYMAHVYRTLHDPQRRKKYDEHVDWLELTTPNAAVPDLPHVRDTQAKTVIEDLVRERFNCQAVVDQSGIWIFDSQQGHYLSADDLKQFRRWTSHVMRVRKAPNGKDVLTMLDGLRVPVKMKQKHLKGKLRRPRTQARSIAMEEGFQWFLQYFVALPAIMGLLVASVWMLLTFIRYFWMHPLF